MVFSLLLIAIGFVWLLWETRCLTIRLPAGRLSVQEIEAARLRRLASENRRRSGPRARLRARALTACPIFLLVFMSPSILQYAVIQCPGPSRAFDCDDSTQWTIERLSLLGIDAKPLLGNLKKEGAAYWESDHIWVVVEVFGRWVAVDWGSIRFDAPHYKGYVVSREELAFFVEQDRRAAPEAQLPASASIQ